MYLYQNLKKARTDKKMSQKAVAEHLKMFVQQYNRYELGERELPMHLFVELARLYNVSLDYLAGLTDEPKPLN